MAGILLYYEQALPDTDSEGLARTVDEVFNQYGTDGVKNELVDIGEWYVASRVVPVPPPSR